MRPVYRPLPAVWPSGRRTPGYLRQRSRFKSTATSTWGALEREIRHLGVGLDGTIVIEAGYAERDIRLDGMPRANARPDDPAIVISFESKFGPLRYGCDTYDRHEDNIRAVALALEALRAVDRYGVTKRGEQYHGWVQLEAHTESRGEAERLLAKYGGEKAALKTTHPDVNGGDRAAFEAVQSARRALGLR